MDCLSLPHCVLGMMATVVACDAPPEEDSAAFRTVDAQDADDVGLPQGGPNDLCDDCGSYWMASREHVGIYLEEAVGEGVLSLNRKATVFFKGEERGMRFEVSANFNEEFKLYVIKVPRRFQRPPWSRGLHPLPGFGSEEAVLRFENDQASVDVRLDRFYGNDERVTDQVDPVTE